MPTQANVGIVFTTQGIPQTLAGMKKVQEQAEQSEDQQKKGNLNIVSGLGKLGLAIQGVEKVYEKLAFVGKQAYSILLAQNEALNQQILASQASLAATTDVFIDGQQVEESIDAIKALETPIRNAIEGIREESLELVGVTSDQLIPLFQILSTNAAELTEQSAEFGEPIKAAEKLTISFAASLGTLNIPLFQARQEINSILQGTIDQNSALAKQLNITSDQVRLWKSQGVLVDRLLEKLEPMVAGNALAAKSVSGITSNIQEIFEEITRQSTEGLYDPVIAELEKVYRLLEENRDVLVEGGKQALEYLGNIVRRLYEVVTVMGRNLKPIMVLLGKILKLSLDGWVKILDYLVLIVEKVGDFANFVADLVRKTGQIARNIKDWSLGLGRVARQEREIIDFVDDLRQKYKKRKEEEEKARQESADSVSIEAKLLRSLGTAYEQMAEKAIAAEEKIIKSRGKKELVEAAAKELLSITQKQLELGQINEKEAKKRLENIRNQQALNYEQILSAEKQITQLVERETKKRLKAVTEAQRKVRDAIALGRLSRQSGELAKIDKQLDEEEVRLEQFRKSLREEQRFRGSDTNEARELIDKISESETKILEIEKQFRDKSKELLAQETKTELAQVEELYSDRSIADIAYYKSKLELEVAQLDLTLRFRRHSLSKLSEQDVIGRQALNEEIFELEKQKNEKIRASLRSLEDIYQQNIRTTQAVVKALKERQIPVIEEATRAIEEQNRELAYQNQLLDRRRELAQAEFNLGKSRRDLADLERQRSLADLDTVERYEQLLKDPEFRKSAGANRVRREIGRVRDSFTTTDEGRAKKRQEIEREGFTRQKNELFLQIRLQQNLLQIEAQKLELKESQLKIDQEQTALQLEQQTLQQEISIQEAETNLQVAQRNEQFARATGTDREKQQAELDRFLAQERLDRERKLLEVLGRQRDINEDKAAKQFEQLEAERRIFAINEQTQRNEQRLQVERLRDEGIALRRDQVTRPSIGFRGILPSDLRFNAPAPPSQIDLSSKSIQEVSREIGKQISRPNIVNNIQGNNNADLVREFDRRVGAIVNKGIRDSF